MNSNSDSVKPSTALCIYLIFWFSSIETYADVSGPVVGIIDGDTIEVLHNNKAESIRLNGIDCPEKGQAYGQKAKQAASALAFGRDVTIETHGKDKYKRTIGDVILPDGTNLNQELVKQGWCWWYRKYAPRDVVLEGLETEAREERKGLWAVRQPVPPREYRIGSKSIHSNPQPPHLTKTVCTTSPNPQAMSMEDLLLVSSKNAMSFS